MLKERLIQEVKKVKYVSNKAKESLIKKQITPKESITEKEFKYALKNLRSVLIREDLKIGKREILEAKALKLEVHRYSPEQNKLHLKDGTVLKARYADTIEKAIEMNL